MSDKALGGCLTQIDKNRIPRLVAYYSKKLKEAELNYNIYNKELLAIVDCLRHWRVYLSGAAYTVEVWSDHQNLTY